MRDKNGCKIPCVLQVVDIILLVGALVLAISQFTGLYYHYDNTNTYVRSPYNAIAYVIPVLALLLQLVEIIWHYNHFVRRMVIPLVLFIVMPIMASVSQFIFHTVSLTGLTVVAMTAVLYSFSLFDINEELKAAHRRQLDMLRSREELSKKMLAETASALAEAIDAKDSYTNGHSNRVAKYSRMIAQVAGKSQQLCDEIYLIALLHDVGKIGIPNAIINKNGKLTNEEYDIIKTHPAKGNEILKKISSSPNLAIGAHYHHERYDGKGYPEGLKGEEIPEIARIIACADAYDAMASKRSYRDVLPRNVIRAEFEKNLGTQFDPKFGQIMLHLIDCDTNYQMREK
ncbi:HD-GYP domain-containing protein [Candidatus Saccharibacteria bacterium]|nr:HD-GYP domain-containing protein [Candidatus Saccharibacteria bacterium]